MGSETLCIWLFPLAGGHCSCYDEATLPASWLSRFLPLSSRPPLPPLPPPLPCLVPFFGRYASAFFRHTCLSVKTSDQYLPTGRDLPSRRFARHETMDGSTFNEMISFS